MSNLKKKIRLIRPIRLIKKIRMFMIKILGFGRLMKIDTGIQTMNLLSTEWKNQINEVKVAFLNTKNKPLKIINIFILMRL
jgi:hypothetical protein